MTEMDTLSETSAPYRIYLGAKRAHDRCRLQPMHCDEETTTQLAPGTVSWTCPCDGICTELCSGPRQSQPMAVVPDLTPGSCDPRINMWLGAAVAFRGQKQFVVA